MAARTVLGNCCSARGPGAVAFEPCVQPHNRLRIAWPRLSPGLAFAARRLLPVLPWPALFRPRHRSRPVPGPHQPTTSPLDLARLGGPPRGPLPRPVPRLRRRGLRRSIRRRGIQCEVLRPRVSILLWLLACFSALVSRKHCISDSRISQRGIKIKPTVNLKKIRVWTGPFVSATLLPLGVF